VPLWIVVDYSLDGEVQSRPERVPFDRRRTNQSERMAYEHGWAAIIGVEERALISV